MAQTQEQYPVQLSVDYPDRPLSRLSTAFRLILIIPIAIILSLMSSGAGVSDLNSVGAMLGGILFAPPLLMILFRRKYPRWWFDWNLALVRFSNRVEAYALLLRDEYPSTDAEQAVHLEVRFPNVETELNRWLPLVKWLLAIPHYVVLILISIAALIVVIIAWFAILFTARYPRGLFAFVVGVQRWWLRVYGYAFILTTDRYPPFRLSP